MNLSVDKGIRVCLKKFLNNNNFNTNIEIEDYAKNRLQDIFLNFFNFIVFDG